MGGGESGESKANSPVEAIRAGALDSPEDIYCPECDYNLRGLTSDRCPECGFPLESIRRTASLIPWVYRSRIGWYRAYWRTVWLVMFRTKRFCSEIARPVSSRHAQSFRWISVLHAFVPLAVLALLAWFASPGHPGLFATDLGNHTFLAVLLLSAFLCLAALTGVPSYFFHPKYLTIKQQDRAVAMSYYACGALAWTPLALVIDFLTAFAYGVSGHYPWLDFERTAFVVFGFMLCGMPLLVWWLDLIHVSRHSVRRNTSAVIRVAVAVPVLWVVVGGLTLVGIPFTVLYVALVVVSFG